MMDKNKVMNDLNDEINYCLRNIAECVKENRNLDRIFYQGMMQAYEVIRSRVHNDSYEKEVKK